VIRQQGLDIKFSARVGARTYSRAESPLVKKDRLQAKMEAGTEKAGKEGHEEGMRQDDRFSGTSVENEREETVRKRDEKSNKSCQSPNHHL
jgi:hypothetical protein